LRLQPLDVAPELRFSVLNSSSRDGRFASPADRASTSPRAPSFASVTIPTSGFRRTISVGSMSMRITLTPSGIFIQRRCCSSSRLPMPTRTSVASQGLYPAPQENP
jgi:hypothetical protein